MKKLLIRLIILVSLIFYSCNNEITSIEGTYNLEVTFKYDNSVQKGLMILTTDEMNIFFRNIETNEMIHKGKFKYYIEDNKMFTCNTATNYCEDKTKYEEHFEIKFDDDKIILENSNIKNELIKNN